MREVLLEDKVSNNIYNMISGFPARVKVQNYGTCRRIKILHRISLTFQFDANLLLHKASHVVQFSRTKYAGGSLRGFLWGLVSKKKQNKKPKKDFMN